MIKRTDMTSFPSGACPCADAARARKSPRRRAAEFALLVALAIIVVLGETWAIARAPALPSALIHVFSDGHGLGVVPVAIIH
jgi:hypothetical protein